MNGVGYEEVHRIQSFIYLFYLSSKIQWGQVKRNLLLFFAPIVIFLGVFISARLSGVELMLYEPIRIGLYLPKEDVYFKLLEKSFFLSEEFGEHLIVIKENREKLQERFEKREIDALIEFPQDYFESLMYFEPNPIRVSISNESPIKKMMISDVIASFEKYIRTVEASVYALYDTMSERGFGKAEKEEFNEKLSLKLISSLLNRNEVFEYHSITPFSGIGVETYYLSSIMIQVIIFLSFFAGMELSKLRENKVSSRVQLTHTSYLVFLLGWLSGISCFLFSLVAFWMILIHYFLVDISFFIQVLGYLYLVTFGCVVFGCFFSCFIRNQKDLMMVYGTFLFVTTMLGGTITPVPIISPVLNPLTRLMPNYWMQSGFLICTSEGISSNLVGILLTIILVVILMLGVMNMSENILSKNTFSKMQLNGKED